MTLAIKKRVALYGFVGLSLVGFCILLHGLLVPDTLRSTDPAKGIGYVYAHDDGGEVSRIHLVQGDFWSYSEDEQIEAVVLRMEGPDGSEHELALHSVPGTRHWAGAIGTDRGGKVRDNFTDREISIPDSYFFTLEIRTSEDRTVVLRPEKTWLKKLMGGAEEERFRVTFEGEVPLVWLMLHIALMAAAPVFLAHGVYYSLLILMNIGDPLPKLRASLFWGWICITASVLPLGIIVSEHALNRGFAPWPLGGDILSAQSLFLVLLGLGGWIPLRKTGERTWAWATLAAALVCAAVVLIPHS